MDEHNLTRGPVVEVSPQGQIHGANRFEEALRLAELGGNHVWIAITTYLIKDPSQTLFLDSESLCGPPHIGCFRCEEVWSQALATRRCKGTAKWEKVE